MDWSFDVVTAKHDDLKFGLENCRKVRSRISVSSEAFPKWETAAEVAACMAVAIHGGMPLSILPRY